MRDIKTQNPTTDELRTWHTRSGLPLKRFFNTSGMVYRDRGLKDKLPEMSEEQQYAALASDGSLGRDAREAAAPHHEGSRVGGLP